MNDGCCDPGGRFWAGSMSYDADEGAGSLYRVGADGTVAKALDGMTRRSRYRRNGRPVSAWAAQAKIRHPALDPAAGTGAGARPGLGDQR
jgi:hypothetical protein